MNLKNITSSERSQTQETSGTGNCIDTESRVGVSRIGEEGDGLMGKRFPLAIMKCLGTGPRSGCTILSVKYHTGLYSLR
jgi:hypothetical protein